MHRSLFARSLAIAASAALLVAGCGGGASTTSSKSPTAAFRAGLSGLDDTDVLTITLKLDTTADTLIGLAKAGGTTIDSTVANAIAGAQLVIETKTLDGKKLSEHKGAQSGATATRFALDDNGTTYAELRSLNGALYVKADVKGLLDLFGQSKLFTEVQARANTLPTFVKALVDGKWVSLDINLLKSLVSQFGGGAAASPNPAQTQRLLADLKAVIQRDVTVTRIGTDDQGDHVQLTAHSRQFATDILQAFTGAIPAAGLATGKLDPSTMPDHSVVVDVWVNNGALAKVSLDFAQFIPADKKKPGDKLPIVLTFDRSGDDISKPDGATPVDLRQLVSLLGGLGG
jgi:hypothetical protein